MSGWRDDGRVTIDTERLAAASLLSVARSSSDRRRYLVGIGTNLTVILHTEHLASLPIILLSLERHGSELHVLTLECATLFLFDGLAGRLAEVAPELLPLGLLDALLERLKFARLLTCHGLLIRSRHKLALLQITRHGQRHGLVLQRMCLDWLLARRVVQRAMGRTLREVRVDTAVAGGKRVLGGAFEHGQVDAGCARLIHLTGLDGIQHSHELA